MITAVFGDAVLDPATGEQTREAVVLIENGRVTKAGRRNGTQVPRDATTIVAAGRLEILLAQLSGALQLALGEIHLRGRLPQLCTRHRERRLIGPRIDHEQQVALLDHLAVREMDLGQIAADTGADLDIPLPDRPYMVVDGVEAMRLRVREVIRAGADWIKLCTSGGVLSPGDQPHHSALTLEEIKAAVDEAATQGRKVMAHAQANAGIKNALKAGVATIEHGIWLDGDAIEMMLDGGNALIPTLVAPHWVIRHAEAGKMPAYAIDKARAVIDDHKASIRQAIESGVKIAFGTDTGVGPHGSNGEEFLLMRDLGMEPIDCIRSATSVAADTIGMQGVGRLEPGSWGDLIGVPGDPVADLSLLAKPENVHLVLKGGEVIKSSQRSMA